LRVTLLRHTNHIIAELLGKRLRHGDILPGQPCGLANSDVTYPCSSPGRCLCGGRCRVGPPSTERTTWRNGYRHRDLDTRAGTRDMAVRRLRQGSCCTDWLLERRRRAESALITVVADCYLAGVSTRRMDKLVGTLGINSLSKSQGSRMTEDLDEHVEQFRHRPLDEAGPFTFVSADALTMKGREGGRAINAVVRLATGGNGA